MSFHLQYFTSPTMRIRSDFVAAFLAAGIPGSHVVSLHHVEPRVLLKLLALISSTRWKGQFSSTSLLHTIGGNIIRNSMFKSITYLYRYIRSIMFGIYLNLKISTSESLRFGSQWPSPSQGELVLGGRGWALKEVRRAEPAMMPDTALRRCRTGLYDVADVKMLRPDCFSIVGLSIWWTWQCSERYEWSWVKDLTSMSHSKDSAHMLCSLLLARMHSLSPVALRQLAVAVDSPEKERLPTNWKDLVFLHLSHGVAFFASPRRVVFSWISPIRTARRCSLRLQKSCRSDSSFWAFNQLIASW